MRPRILVVEDDRYFAGILRDYLEYIGWRVDLAHDGDEGLAIIERDPPDFLICDVLLPRRSGLELALAAKNQDEDLPVLIISAAYDKGPSIDAQMRQCKADDYLIKPFTMPELKEKLSTLRSIARADVTDPNLEMVRFPGRREMPTEGRVEPGFLADLMLSLRAAGHTGVLALRDQSRWKDIVFLEGRPVWADGGDHADRLGTMLLEKGVLQRAQFERAVAAMSGRGLDFGSALTELGYLTATELYTQLRALVMRRVVLAFSWGVGQWTLGSVFPRQSSSFEVAPLAAIYGGMLASGDRAGIHDEISGYADRFVVPSRRFATQWAELKADPDIAALGPFLTGTRTVAQLRAFEIVEPAVLDMVLWVLFRAGAIGFGEVEVPDARVEESVVLPPRLGSDQGLMQVAERIIRDYLKHWQKDYFAIFGLEQDAGDGAVDEALQGDVLDWEPDTLPEDLPGDLRSKARALHAWVGQAYDTLDDGDQRQAYRARLDEGLTGFYRKVEQPGVAEALMFFQLGKGLIRSRNFLEAERAFQRAAERVPNSGEYLAYLGYANYRRGGATVAAAREARAKLEAALQLDPHSAMAWFFTGVIARDQKDYGRAKEAFTRAVSYDPGFEPAARALTQVADLLDGARGPLRGR